MLKLVAGMVLMGLAAYLGHQGAWLGDSGGVTLLVNLVLFFGGLELWVRSEKHGQ